MLFHVTGLPSLALVSPRRHDPSHHLLLGYQMVDPLQVPEQTLHVAAPFIQHVVRITRFGEVDQSRGPVDLGVDRLQRNQLADVFLRLLLCQVQERCKTSHLDPRVVLGHHAHVVLDHPLPEVLPSSIGLVIDRLAGLSVEDIGAAEVGSKLARDIRPAHQFVSGKQLHKPRFLWDSGKS